MRSAKRSELLIESEVRSAESLEVRSAKSPSDVAPKARAGRCESQSGFLIYFLIYIYIFIYFDVCMALNNGTDIT